MFAKNINSRESRKRIKSLSEERQFSECCLQKSRQLWMLSKYLFTWRDPGPCLQTFRHKFSTISTRTWHAVILTYNCSTTFSMLQDSLQNQLRRILLHDLILGKASNRRNVLTLEHGCSNWKQWGAHSKQPLGIVTLQVWVLTVRLSIRESIIHIDTS